MAISLNDIAAQLTGTINTHALEDDTIKVEVLADDRYFAPQELPANSAVNFRVTRRTLADGTQRFDIEGMTPKQFYAMMELIGEGASSLPDGLIKTLVSDDGQN